MGKIQLNKKIYYGILFIIILFLVYSIYKSDKSLADFLVPNLNSTTGISALIMLFTVIYIILYIIYLKRIPFLKLITKPLNLLIVPALGVAIVLMFGYSFLVDLFNGNEDIATVVSVIILIILFFSRYIIFKEEDKQTTGNIGDLFWKQNAMARMVNINFHYNNRLYINIKSNT